MELVIVTVVYLVIGGSLAVIDDVWLSDRNFDRFDMSIYSVIWPIMVFAYIFYAVSWPFYKLIKYLKSKVK